MAARRSRLFVARAIPLVLVCAVLALVGVLAVDLFIENRQVNRSIVVAESTVQTLEQVDRVAGNLESYEGAVDSAGVRGKHVALDALRASIGRLVQRMSSFDEHVRRPSDRAQWHAIQERMSAKVLDPELPLASAEEQVRSLEEDLSIAGRIVKRVGLDDLKRAEQLHTLHGLLEALVISFLGGVAIALLIRWHRQELQAREPEMETVEHLRQTIAELDQFAGRIAHDLRAPLQPILIGSQAIGRAAGCDLVRTQAELITRSSRRLSRMCDVLLQMARLSRGVTREGPPVYVNAEIREVIAEFDEKARDRGASIAAELGSDFAVACPSEVIHALVSNLIDNALKYGKKEGAPPRVIVRTHVEDPWGSIEVEDEGPGISPELRARVFEPLFRGQTGGEGVGLGLSIVQRLVDRLRGCIDICAGQKGGALFRIVLPSAPTTPPTGDVYPVA